ncbi:hypothetical protein BX600DRAFT_511617 [Xylariales sp. PMI_506]|nr:hypothetical protein BX600DRAFT_511617 [Xylariales sp. PMI_506]
MADSMCGPSAPTKGLTRLLDQDHSRQQDRMRSTPQQGPQNFRSLGAHAANANNEFQEFQNANSGLPFAPLPFGGLLNTPIHHPGGIPVSQPQFSPSPLAGQQQLNNNWINEFRDMSINPQTIAGSAGQLDNRSAVHFGHPASMAPIAQPMSMMPGVPFMPSPMAFQPQSWAPNFTNPYMAGMGHSGFETANFSGQQHSHQEISNAYEADFEAEMNAWLDAQVPEPELGEKPADQATLPAETPQATEPVQGQDKNDTELARVAQQLVDSVSNDTSEKFKNSNFLEMMRRIAGGQVVVEGNNLVDTTQPKTDAAAAPETDKGKAKE